MRRFSPEYLERTRRGLWESREALAGLRLGSRRRVLDVGCGTGEFTRVLAEEAPAATVVGLDADPSLVRVARSRTSLPYLVGDALRLPFADGTFDLVVCQALLVNLPDPAAAVEEFARASSALVAAVEPDNAAVEVESTVPPEAALERRAREAYLEGVGTDVAPGDRLRDLFREAGLSDVRTSRHRHEKLTAPPYGEAALEDARRKATGAGLAAHRAELERALSPAAYETLRGQWRAMGRSIVDQMRDGTYERREVVPFDVTVGRTGTRHTPNPADS